MAGAGQQTCGRIAAGISGFVGADDCPRADAGRHITFMRDGGIRTTAAGDASASEVRGRHVLLIDDIMGELDLKRRTGFLPLLEQAHRSRGQVFMTATEQNWPEELGRNAQRWLVKDGELEKQNHEASASREPASTKG